MVIFKWTLVFIFFFWSTDFEQFCWISIELFYTWLVGFSYTIEILVALVSGIHICILKISHKLLFKKFLITYMIFWIIVCLVDFIFFLRSLIFASLMVAIFRIFCTASQINWITPVNLIYGIEIEFRINAKFIKTVETIICWFVKCYNKNWNGQCR